MVQPATGADVWLRRFHPSPTASTRLVCFPHAGGTAGSYLALSASLAPDVEVTAVQYPARQDRLSDPPVRSISELADAITAILPTETPYAFFGHSMGAVVAYEVALRLHEERGPTHLFASGRQAPSRQREESTYRRDDAALLAEIASLGGTDRAVLENSELVRMALPSIRGDYTAIETYRHTPGRVLDIPVTALVGEEDPRTTLDEAAVWAEHTTSAFTLRVYPGDHFFLVPQHRQVVALIRETLTPGGGFDAPSPAPAATEDPSG